MTKPDWSPSEVFDVDTGQLYSYYSGDGYQLTTTEAKSLAGLLTSWADSLTASPAVQGVTANEALGFIDQTIYANEGSDAWLQWRNDEVLTLLRDIRALIVSSAHFGLPVEADKPEVDTDEARWAISKFNPADEQGGER